MNKNLKIILFGLSLIFLLTGLSSAISGPVTGLSESSTGDSWIEWSWTNPVDSEFDGTVIYLDGVQQTTLPSTESSYNATSLTPSTSYEIEIRSINTTGDLGVWTNDSATTAASTDTTPPGPVTGLNESSTEASWVEWSWTNPVDSDFNGSVIYLDGVQQTTLSSGVTSFNATSLSSDTSYEIGVRTVDTTGNLGTWVNDSATTAVSTDTTPPGPVTGLSETSKSENWIEWSWTNPTDSDFNGSVIYLDGVQQTTLSSGVTSFNATSLSSDTSYEIGVRTVDTTGNLGTWVNDSATTDVSSGPDVTAPGTVTSLEVDERGSDWIKWTWVNPADSDFDYSMVYIDDNFVANVSDAYYTATNLSSSTDYTIKLRTVDTSGNINPTDIINTTSTYSMNYFSGDRIWDETADQSRDKYVWDAKSFSGFFYDLDSGLSSENMTIYNIDESLDEDDIVYQTRPVETTFEQSAWGSYEVIGFMAEKYFAAYTGDTRINGIETVSMMSNGQLSKVLIDNDDEESVFSGSALVLQEGYQLNIVEVDVNGDSVYVTLTKDGDELDSGVVSGGSNYIYETDLGDSDDVALIIVHFNEIFSGRESNAVFVEGVFQISEDYLELENGDSYGDMEITSITSNLIKMENDGTVSLSEGDIVNLMGNIKLIVADSDVLRFAPFVDMSDPGTYELRGTVAEDQDEFTWTPLNFEGFYYDIDEGIMTETLKVTEKSGDTIQNLEYRSTPASVKFEHSQWGEFEVIGFMAEKYFAGYNDTTFVDDDVSLISSGQLAEVLLDTDDEVSVYSGSSLVLEEGYTLDILEVDTDGDSVLVELSKDGDEVDTSVVSSGGDYVYEVDVGDADDVPVIIIHFNEVFSGRESNAVFVEGIFQISEDYLELEDGDNYGEMEIDGFTDDYILMTNDGSISLGSGDEISLMGDISIKVADSSDLRYYPFVEVSTEPTGTLNVDLSETTVIEGTEITITVTSRGASVSDATIKVEDTTVGTTDEEGILEYTPSETGTLEIVAEKEGYTSGSDELEVISEDDESRKLVIEVSPDEVYEGTSATIFVLKAIGSEAVEGAEVTLDGNSIGSTSLDGTITYTMTEVGTHRLEATKSGFLDAELNLEVQELAANFEFSNLRITPLDVEEGEEATFSVDVTNTGTAAGEYTADLKVNGTVVDSQTVSLGMDESQTIEFKHTEEEPGVYTAEVGDLSEEYEVFESSGTIWYILGAIVLLVAGGIGYLFTAGGWTVEIAQAKVDEAIQSIQELIGNLR